ncbi:delta-like protein 1 [Octopus bimaculoides]|uniref:delta-like protein 1 n=1 Tax=Octopus bimaculoides TaxID=37653 RepID=UPI0022E2E2A9|nr:delta-like protein 1 [Octopus bimaculoides]
MLQSTGRFLLCAFLATIISPIVADYVIDVKLIKFENYNRLLANGRTCSNFGSQQCQTTLEVCARPGDSSTLCSYGNTKTGVIGDNVIDLNKTFIGFTRNPITYLVTQPFQSYCSQDYYGPNCAIRCYIPISEQTRFQCGPNGEKVCKPGFTGSFCNADGIRNTRETINVYFILAITMLLIESIS